MANPIVAGELYETLTGQLFELGRQLRQPNGYPFNPFQLKLHLQAAIEGKFGPGEIYEVKLGGPETTDQITAKLGFPFSDWITQKNFPLKPHDPETVEIEIINPGTSFSEEEGLEFLKAAGLERPTYEQAIRFAEQYGKATTSEKKPFVIFLHEAWQGPFRDRRVVYLGRDARYRGLDLNCPDDRFDGHCVLAGVRPRKRSSAA